MFPTKVCRECNRSFPVETYPRSARSRDGHMHICAACVSEIGKRKWRELHALQQVRAAQPVNEWARAQSSTVTAKPRTVTVHVGEGVYRQKREVAREQEREQLVEREREQLVERVTERVVEALTSVMDTQTRALTSAPVRSVVPHVDAERLTLLETWVTEPTCSPRGEHFVVGDVLIRRYGDKFALYVNDASSIPPAPHEDISADVLIFLVRVTLRVASDVDVYGLCYR